MPITPTVTTKEAPKIIRKKCKLVGPVQDARGKHFGAGIDIELVTDFGNDTYNVKLPNGANVICGPGVLDLKSVVDFVDEAPAAVVKVETAPAQEMLSGDELKVGKGSEKAKEQQAVRKYRDARYLYTRACEMGCKDVESAVEKYINEELVPALPKDFKMPMDSYCFSKEEVKSAVLTPQELKAVVDFSKTVDVKPPVKKKPLAFDVAREKPEPKKVSGLTIPSKKYAVDFEGGSVVDFNVVGFHKQTPKEVLINGIKHIERPIPVFFKLGDYPDKDNFSMSAEEGAAAVKDFAENLKDGAPIVISHKPTVLDDHNTAKLVGLELKGDTFSATARLPEWLDKFVVKSGKMGISARWSKDKKRLIHGALVPDPRIEDAAVVAEFSKSLYAEFEANIPYDAPPMAGDGTPAPEPDEDNNGEGDSTQALHGKELGEAIEQEIQMTLADIQKDPERHAGKYVGVLQKLLALAQGLQGGDAQEEESGGNPAISTPNGQQDSASFSKEKEALTTQVVTLKNENVKLREENINIRATSAATVARIAKKITPPEFNDVVFDLKKAAEDDQALGTVDFAKGESRFSKAVKRLMGKETHPLMVSTADLAGGQFLSGDKGVDFAKEEAKAKQREMDLSATEVGRQVLAQERAAKAAKNGHSNNGHSQN